MCFFGNSTPRSQCGKERSGAWKVVSIGAYSLAVSREMTRKRAAGKSERRKQTTRKACSFCRNTLEFCICLSTLVSLHMTPDTSRFLHYEVTRLPGANPARNIFSGPPGTTNVCLYTLYTLQLRLQPELQARASPRLWL